jgi:hypothetical protein
MAEIYISIRNQNQVAMSSINGQLIVVLISRDQVFQVQQPVMLRTATAIFRDLVAGNYSILVRHPDLTPTEVRYDTQLTANTIFGIRFFYNEPDRCWLSLETEERFLP